MIEYAEKTANDIVEVSEACSSENRSFEVKQRHR